MEDKEYYLMIKLKKISFLKFDTKNISNLDNFVINFYNDGLISEFDVLKSPDLKLIGFKLNYLILKKL